MLDSMDDGCVKLFVIHSALQLRRSHPDLFQKGDYTPLWAEAPHDQRIIAFARRFENKGVIVVAPRLLAAILKAPGLLPLGAQNWGDARLALPWLPPDTTLVDVFGDRLLNVQRDERGAHLALGEILRDFPVGLIYFETVPSGPT